MNSYGETMSFMLTVFFLDRFWLQFYLFSSPHCIQVEYHRQGYDAEFHNILEMILDSLSNKEVSDIYEKRDDFVEGMTKIFETIACKSLSKLAGLKQDRRVSDKELSACRSRISEMLKKAEGTSEKSKKASEYTQIVKGFYSILQEDHRAAENYFNAATRGQSKEKKGTTMFAAYVGNGIISFSKNKWQPALESFAKAIQENPSCGPSLRIAVASCLFSLKEYDKAAYAVKAAFDMDNASVPCLCMMALLEQVYASQDRSRRFEHRLNANEYWVMVNALDPMNASALIHMANHAFFSLADVGDAVVESVTSLNIRGEKGANVAAGDYVLFDADTGLVEVKEVYAAQGATVIVLAIAISEDVVGNSIATVKHKSISRVVELAEKVLEISTTPQVRAEALYILGRTAHQKSHIKEAKTAYKDAVKEWSQMELAIFGLAQILFSEKRYADASQLFRTLEKRNPGDNDTKAYLYLIGSLEKPEKDGGGKIVPVDKIKEVAGGFSFEVDLWLIQGALRQRKPDEFPAALKCYLFALESAKNSHKYAHVVPAILNNIAALQLHLDRLDLALDNIRHALQLMNEAQSEGQDNLLFSDGEFEGIFYSWSEPVAQVKAGKAEGEFIYDGVNPVPLREGDRVSVGEVIHTVTALSDSGFSSYSPLSVFDLSSSSGASTLPLRVKVSRRNFTDETLSLCFNYARILEESGKTTAASELYVALAKAHPSFTDCYLRLSNINQNMGNKEQAKLWIDRSIIVNEASGDALITLGDMYQRENSFKEAKKVLDELVAHDKKDPRPMLAIGNLYHQIYAQSREEKDLNLTYKYYHTVLQKDKSNAYAATGLGVYCAEKGEYEPARQMLTRVREAGLSASDDINNDLAHVNLIQGRITEAEHLYLSTLKTVIQRQRRPQRGLVTSTFEAMAMAQYKSGRHEEALRSLLRSLHQEPSASGALRVWYNIAVVRAANATSLMSRNGRKSVKSINNARRELSAAQDLFTYLSTQKVSSADKSKYYSSSSAARHGKNCDKTLGAFEDQLQRAEQEEAVRREERKRQDEEHQERMRRKHEEKEREVEAAEAAKLEAKMKAQEKKKELEALRETWAAAPVKEPRQTGKGRKKKGALSQFDDILPPTKTFDDSDDELDQVGGALTTSSKGAKDDPANDSDSDDSLFGSSGSKKRKVDEDDEGGKAASSTKKSRVIDDEDEGEFDAGEPKKDAATAEEANDSDDDLFG